MIRPPFQQAIRAPLVQPLRGEKAAPYVEPVATTLAQIAAYNVTAKSWATIPWGPETWTEGATPRGQWVDVDLPASAAPVNGYPVICWFHPNGSSKEITDPQVVTQKSLALSNGFAFMSFEFRHPVPNVALGAPHTDAGLAIQYARGLSTALNLDQTNFFGMTQSRGTLALWQTLQPDMQNVSGPTWASRQSSKLKAIWSYQGQTTYSTTEMANTWIVAGDRATFLANYPDDARWKSALQAVPTAGSLPPLTMRHRDTYPVGLIAWNLFDEHYPGFGQAMGAAYTAAGQGSKFTGADNIGGAAAWTGMIAWFAGQL
jgi:hypothetical protein